MEIRTKNPKVEAILSDFVDFLKTVDEAIACYIAGSYPYGFYQEGVSDIDLTVIFDTVDYHDKQLIIEKKIEGYDIDMDLHYFSRQYIFDNIDSNYIREGIWGPKIIDILIYGEDVLKDFVLPEGDEYARITFLKTLDHFKELEETNVSNMKGDIFDIDDEIRRFVTIRKGKLSIKMMVVASTWIASSMIAKDYHLYTACKNETVSQYRKLYDDGETMYELLEYCKGKWNYILPESQDDIEKFRTFCRYICAKKIQMEEKFAIK